MTERINNIKDNKIAKKKNMNINNATNTNYNKMVDNIKVKNISRKKMLAIRLKIFGY